MRESKGEQGRATDLHQAEHGRGWCCCVGGWTCEIDRRQGQTNGVRYAGTLGPSTGGAAERRRAGGWYCDLRDRKVIWTNVHSHVNRDYDHVPYCSTPCGLRQYCGDGWRILCSGRRHF